jgi:hypothetical protein
MTGTEYELSVMNWGTCWFRFFCVPCLQRQGCSFPLGIRTASFISGSYDLLQRKMDKLFLRFYDLLQRRKAEKHMLFLKFLQLTILDMPRCHI